MIGKHQNISAFFHLNLNVNGLNLFYAPSSRAERCGNSDGEKQKRFWCDTNDIDNTIWMVTIETINLFIYIYLCLPNKHLDT